MSRVPLRKVIEGYIGGGWGKEAPDQIHTVPASVIRGTDLDAIQSGVTDGVPYRWHKASNARSRALVAGDIVFEVSGGSKDQPVGRSLLLDNARIAKFQGSVIPASFCKRITPNRNSIHPRFLLAHLQLAWADRRIVQWQVQSTGISNFNFEAFLDDFVIELPFLPIQRRIAGILTAYDELIENSQRRIKILESMARALYREWFVHYRFPDHESVDRVSSSLGEIPEGWEVKKVGDISSYINRGITPQYDEEGDSLVINQKCIRDQRLNLEPARRQSKVIPREKQVCFGDVLINSTGVGTLGRVAQVYENLEFCTVDTHVTIARAAPNTDLDFYGCCLLSIQETFERLGIGATGQTELARSSISDVELIVPPEILQRQFGEVVRGMRMAATTYARQIQNLRRTRDLLLPRLLSGQINVEDIL
jgi:type I restriction enzyme S subunit